MNESNHRRRPALLPFEIALIAGLFWADEAGYVPLSKTPFLLIVAWGSMWLRGVSWRDAGLQLPPHALRIAAIGVATGVAMWLLEFFFTMPMLQRVLAAFGEEMVWRGYALLRVAELAGSGTQAWIVALVVVNVAFGVAHLYQGPSGVIQATVGGMLLGILYIATGRNLLAPILAHGIGNSIDLTVMYFGLYPGVG